ncbi:NAD(P)(+)--arginine ADP-ribosyltransferase 2-like [Colossoma macropomum]|uniref:NAD(P)(+)--arginine ADP-ribosyltransferase 2-like n=1 Tax=Colossoma macropomum TaxID=42526 RepID=UPI0018653D2B|nr:NAD(P)(+)--arginine ADP-ribosyltransferase 2-like [Colossoma macropomum]
MKMTVSVATVLFLMTVSVSVRKSSGQTLPLDMANNSVDDSFEGCKADMYKLVESKYTEQEKNHTPGFSAAWQNALSNCNKDGLNINQSAAIYMYTQDRLYNSDCSHVVFNKACREEKAAYKSGDFKFYTLYFFLTEAVQQLKKQLSQRFWCATSYRRTRLTINNVAVNQKIRFGSFTSSSLTNKLINFGEESCFKIKTCYGAKLKKYSAVPHEQEVLIPPYEVFRITAIKKRDQKNKLWCKVVYELKSAGKRSDLKCQHLLKSLEREIQNSLPPKRNTNPRPFKTCFWPFVLVLWV